MLNDLAVEPGQHIAQIGVGAGYYTAMLAELTGLPGASRESSSMHASPNAHAPISRPCRT
jgi:protein-L-isoaspartate O-methyltransferase